MKFSKLITTQVIPATANRNMRIEARDENGNSVIIPYPETKNKRSNKNRGEFVHLRAAKALCRNMGWSGKFTVAKSGNGKYTFMFVEIKARRMGFQSYEDYLNKVDSAPKILYTRKYYKNPNNKEERGWL